VSGTGFRPAGQPRRLAFDPRVPNVARIYDALMDGKDNYAADRDVARELLDAVPGAADAARDNRAFLGRALRFLAGEAGVRQFLDIGTGLPAAGNAHEVAQSYDSAARVVYADCDPMVVLHANALLTDAPDIAVINGDLRYPRDLLTSPGVRALINFDEPVAVLLAAVLHFLEDRDDPWGIAECIKERMAPGSYLVVSHGTGDDVGPDAARRAQELYRNASAPAAARTRDEIERFFDGLVMVSPGLVPAGDWRPDQPVRKSHETLVYAGIGRKATEDRCRGARGQGKPSPQESGTVLQESAGGGRL
jgi:hypothetical protein